MGVCNTILAAGMAELSTRMESGVSHRDAVASLFEESQRIIFTGNGYSAEWPVEAVNRGLPNLSTTPMAIPAFGTESAKEVFEAMKVYSPEECDARVVVMYENYNATLMCEINTFTSMVEGGILPACAKD